MYNLGGLTMNELRRQAAIDKMRTLLCSAWSCSDSLPVENIENLALVIESKREMKRLKREINQLKKLSLKA